MHNMFGLGESIATYDAVKAMQPDKRPFLLSRSTFLGSGRTVAHWTGDNWSTWRDLQASIPGVLSFQLFGIPMVCLCPVSTLVLTCIYRSGLIHVASERLHQKSYVLAG